MRINIRAISFTLALFWGGNVLFTGSANLVWPDHGSAFLDLANSLPHTIGWIDMIYPGFLRSPSLGVLIVGTVGGLLDGLVAGFILGWLYNLFSPTERAAESP